MHLLLGEAEREQRRREMDIMRQQAGADGFECEIIEREEVEKMMPGIRLGDDVVGASFSKHDGDVNPLKLLRAIHASFQHLAAGSARTAGSKTFATTAAFSSPRQRTALSPPQDRPAAVTELQIGADGRPRYPNRAAARASPGDGTPRAALNMALGTVRQTDEGTVQIGNAEEDVEFDDGTTLSAGQAMARRAVRLPATAGLRLIRTWGCIRS